MRYWLHWPQNLLWVLPLWVLLSLGFGVLVGHLIHVGLGDPHDLP